MKNLGKYWKLIGDYDAETSTYSACAGAGQTSPYTPIENAKLIGIRVSIAGEAATSLVEGVQVKLTSSTFKPNSIEVGGIGNGLRTAPAMAQIPLDWAVDQPVVAGVPITVEARCLSGTPVTNRTLIWGCFVS